MKIATLILAAGVALLGGCKSSNTGSVEFPAVPVANPDVTYLENVGQYAADYYGIRRDSFHLYFDDINRTTYPAAYGGIPEGWYIYGLSWANFAVVHSGLAQDRWQVAETASHEICHIAQVQQGYVLTWYAAYADRWFEAECKYMGQYLAINYMFQEGLTPIKTAPDPYWVEQMAKFPRPPLPVPVIGEQVAGNSNTFNITWSTTNPGDTQ